LPEFWEGEGIGAEVATKGVIYFWENTECSDSQKSLATKKDNERGGKLSFSFARNFWHRKFCQRRQHFATQLPPPLQNFALPRI